ncbi:tRNA preQ1(34) S-adenosylmethionine ribosyltransferase-isomerase QueA [Lachnospiraceae bacterium OttesenSCG-928-D06]|nr:tRNA preQ1(34) S-adenosylmethionine ribosyltransferase-isomerase QueA [Lachnospiraceae bacterium OttesenSCG-928-D06]
MCDFKKSDYYFDLPEGLIAQDPLENRSSSRLLTLDKQSGEISHHVFHEIVDFLKKGDCLVLNNTKVIPARLTGIRAETGGHVEVLLLKRLEKDIWETLVRPGKKCKPGTLLSFGDGLLTAKVLETLEEGNRRIQFFYTGIFEEVLDQLGEMPLPPYITHKLADKNRYQTVYAKLEGSAAAPTAGLHFTKELLSLLEEKGVHLAYVTLHVGLGTFRPVKEEDMRKHHMHSEYYEVTKESAELINCCKEAGGKIICVGTTSCRTIESAADENGKVQPGCQDTDIFIYPGYEFKVLDSLITNFHLPESTLVMLVSALAGREHVLQAYKEAIGENYRFFSFGDAMYIADLKK